MCEAMPCAKSCLLTLHCNRLIWRTLVVSPFLCILKFLKTAFSSLNKERYIKFDGCMSSSSKRLDYYEILGI